MHVNEHRLLEYAVEIGVKVGWNRAHKHDGEPPDDVIMTQMIEAVLTELCRWFVFEDAINTTLDTP
jgi:hypothetical protein